MKDLLVVHYRRADPDGWGLHVWGDVAEPVAWDAPVPLAGEDAYGRFAWIPLRPGARRVGVLPHRGDTADGGGHLVDPAWNPEIWLDEGRDEAFGSRAAADGHAVIHYRRPDGAYDGWGLHLWGEAVAEAALTDWARPRLPDGVDSFGAWWRVPLRDPAAALHFVVHAGPVKDPGPDLRIVPAEQPEAYVDAGSPLLHPTRAAADGVVVLHYRAPDDQHDGLTLRPADGDAVRPSGWDSFGAIFHVPLPPDTRTLRYTVPPSSGEVVQGGGHGPDRDCPPAGETAQSGRRGARGNHPSSDQAAPGGEPGPDHDHPPSSPVALGDGREPNHGRIPSSEPAQSDGHRAGGNHPPSSPVALGQLPSEEAACGFGAGGSHSSSHEAADGDGVGGWWTVETGLVGHEVWRVAGVVGHVLPRPPAPDVDLRRCLAHWIDRETVLWEVSGSLRHALVFSPGAALAFDNLRDHAGEAGVLRLSAGELTDEQRRAWPHLAGYTALKVDPRDADLAPEALRGQVAAVARDEEGRLVAATGVQLPGVIDDLYAAAATAPLGPSGRLRPRLALWAPTAWKVELALYGKGGRRTVHRMRRDDATGVWSAHGRPSWMGRDYTFLVTVYSPAAGRMVTSEVTDPYSLATAPDGVRSRLVRLDAAACKPPGWDALAKPAPVPPHRAVIYELHVRDFSASDATVPEELRGTYAAFTRDSDGTRELRALAADGVTHVHLLPVFDLATVPERREDRVEPDCDLAALPPDSERQQECVARTAATDSFNWGYDPLHYTVPEGSYATDPDDRIRQFRAMVAALNRAGLRVVMDVVYNHTHTESVLGPIVPGYYHRLLADGTVATSTCCANTAPEHRMMGRLVVDSIVTWARQYKIDGFRFDLMGHHPKDNILAVRRALDALTPEADGVDGRSIILYGEGWNFGEIADGARFAQATKEGMAGTGVATFADAPRDAVRGGGPFDADPRAQGFGSGLAGTPNGSPANGDQEQQRARLAHCTDLIRIGLTGSLRDYVLPCGRTGGEIRHNGAPAGYARDPGESVIYVDAHDNETLYDALAYKLAPGTPMADRVRMQVLSLAVPLLSQGAAFVHAGSERLRSKSFDRNSYDSGDWFNRLLWDCSLGNGFGGGLPPRADNEVRWPYARPLLADPALRPGCEAIGAARARFGELLRIRSSTPAFALGSGEEVRRRLSFPAAPDGVIVMHVDTAGIDPRWSAVTAVLNATPYELALPVTAPAGQEPALHPVLAASADPVVRGSAFDRASGTLTVPGRTVAVFVTP
ncbi:pullulanase-type alpha-1,6-glucosidase [Nonomuraea bangladeshensis]|uniref:pullulanase-type alpha-1,6-glucosidase n=1 Tax=Nonomuraea bangladeshensis TaxID=404385 RepID=UPI003C2D2BF1